MTPLGDFGATTLKPADAQTPNRQHSNTGETRTSLPCPRRNARRRREEEDARQGRARRESDDEDDAGYCMQSSFSRKVDAIDDRFAGLFESEKFALDPTDPRFRKPKPPSSSRRNGAAAWREEPRSPEKKARRETETRENAKKTATRKTRAARARACARWSKGEAEIEGGARERGSKRR